MLVCNGRVVAACRERFSERAQEFDGQKLSRSNLTSRQIKTAQWFVIEFVLRPLGALCIVELRLAFTGREKASGACI
jgi:hypothetical protein